MTEELRKQVLNTERVSNAIDNYKNGDKASKKRLQMEVGRAANTSKVEILLAKGLSISEIAEELELPESSVRRIASKL